MPARHAQMLDQVRRTMASATHGLADAVLLGRFVEHRDESAFATLVDRHGPMVYRLCCRLLTDVHSAEDAFQATFLVLARKAASVRSSYPVSAWLYGVARRVALKASEQARRRRIREQSPIPAKTIDRGPDPLDQLSGRESLVLLDEGLQQLPEHQRMPLVLCCLEGRTNEEAARLLGCTPGSVKGRLERGRARLHAWLARRGLPLGGVLATIEASRAGAVAGVHAGLRRATVRVALLFAEGDPATISTTVIALATEGIQGMVSSKMKMVLMLVLTLGLSAGGSAVHLLSAKKPDTAEKPAALQKAGAERGNPRRVDALGDPLPAGAVVRLGTERFRHEGEATSLAYSPDGKILAAQTGRGDIILWDARTGVVRRRLQTSFVSRIAFSPDSRIVASAGDHRTLFFWDVATGKVEKKIVLPDLFDPPPTFGESGTMRFSPDGTLFAASSFRMAYLVDVKSSKVIHKFEEQSNSVLAFAPDGKTVALGVWKGRGVKAWEIQMRSVRTGEILRRLEGHTSYLGAITFSPDGKRLASGSNKQLIVWDAQTGKALKRLEHEADSIMDLAFTPDGKTLLSCHEAAGKVRVWDAHTGKEQRPFDQRMSVLRSMALSPDGKTVAVGGVHTTIRLWDRATGRELFSEQQGHDARVNSVAYSPDGKLLASGGDNGQLWIWDAKTGKPVRQLPGTSARCVRFSPDGRRLAFLSGSTTSSGNALHLSDVTTGKELFRLVHEDVRELSALAYSTDGKTVLSTDWVVKNRKDVLAHLNVWDTATGKRLRRLPIGGIRPDCLAIDADGNTVAVGGASDEGGRIRLWDLRRGAEIQSMFTEVDAVTSLAFSPSGRTLVSGSQTLGVRLWEVTTGKEIVHLEGLKGAVSVAFSPDGRLVASGADESRSPTPTTGKANQIRLWNVTTGVAIPSLSGHNSNVTSLAFSPDGSRLASGLRNSTVLLWEVPATAPAKGAALLGAGEMAALWADLAGDDARKAHTAGWKLATAASVPFLSERLKPAPAIDDEQVRRLIADLDADQFAVRQSASEKLARWGHMARPALLKALDDKPSTESRKRLESLLARTKVVAGEEIQAVRAVEALERIATPAAQSLLQRLAKGATQARLTREAKASSSRLAKRSAGKE